MYTKKIKLLKLRNKFLKYILKGVKWRYNHAVLLGGGGGEKMFYRDHVCSLHNTVFPAQKKGGFIISITLFNLLMKDLKNKNFQ